MLDENLPTFLLKPSSDKPKQNSSLLFSQHGSEFAPKYAVHHPDPDQHASRNRYAAALSDAYNPDVLYAEVLLIPEWTQPAAASAGHSIHSDPKGAGTIVPPPPEPVLPDKFVIQLYNPDQQVTVKHKPASWNSAAAWEFELPQQTFRTPSASALDRSQHDPAGLEVTPRIGFKWKKDGKLSKDMACFLSGKTLNADGSKKKSKEPDITVAIFKALKEITLYEPNLIRVEVEDSKGLEVVLLLGAVVIRDVYFGSMKEAFNLDASRKASSSNAANAYVPSTAAAGGTLGIPLSQSPPLAPASGAADQKAGAGRGPRVPPTDPRSQWEIDAETARLRKLAAEEERQRKKREAEQERQLRRMLEEEEREERRRQAEIDRETERLKRLYGTPQLPPLGPAAAAAATTTATTTTAAAAAGGGGAPETAPALPHRLHRPHVVDHQRRQSALLPSEASPPVWGSYNAGPHMSGSLASASQSQLCLPNRPGGHAQGLRLKNKSSIFSFRRNSDQDASKLGKKRSAVF